MDSLLLELKNAKHDTIKVKLFLHLSAECDLKDLYDYSLPLKELCEKNLKDVPKSSSLYFFYKKNLGDALNNIGYYFDKQKGELTKALEFHFESLTVQKEINNKKGVAMSLNTMGQIYKTQGDLNKALEYTHNGLKIREEINDKIGIGTSLNNLGLMYSELGDMSKTIEYYTRATKILEEIGNKKGIALILNNLGDYYYSKGEINKAIEYFERSIKKCLEINNLGGAALSLNNLGQCYRVQERHCLGT